MYWVAHENGLTGERGCENEDQSRQVPDSGSTQPSGTDRAGVGLVILGIIPGPPGPAAIPVGLTILTLDHPRGRRWRRLVIVRVGRRWQAARSKRKMRPTRGPGASVVEGDLKSES